MWGSAQNNILGYKAFMTLVQVMAWGKHLILVFYYPLSVFFSLIFASYYSLYINSFSVFSSYLCLPDLVVGLFICVFEHTTLLSYMFFFIGNNNNNNNNNWFLS